MGKVISMPNYFFGTFEFKDIGRGKATFTKKCKTGEDILSAVRPYLISRDVDFNYDAETLSGEISAGFHVVGSFKRIGDV